METGVTLFLEEKFQRGIPATTFIRMLGKYYKDEILCIPSHIKMIKYGYIASTKKLLIFSNSYHAISQL